MVGVVTDDPVFIYAADWVHASLLRLRSNTISHFIFGGTSIWGHKNPVRQGNLVRLMNISAVP